MVIFYGFITLSFCARRKHLNDIEAVLVLKTKCRKKILLATEICFV